MPLVFMFCSCSWKSASRLCLRCAAPENGSGLYSESGTKGRGQRLFRHPWWCTCCRLEVEWASIDTAECSCCSLEKTGSNNSSSSGCQRFRLDITGQGRPPFLDSFSSDMCQKTMLYDLHWLLNFHIFSFI